MLKLILFGIGLSSLATADYAPVISESGKQRIIENISVLNKNMKLVQTNIVSCKQNASTIEADMKELLTLEQEHLQLKSRYKEQLEITDREMAKNEEAIRELNNFQRNLAANNGEKDKPANQQQDLQKSQQDKIEREKWKNEAKAKAEKIKELLNSVSQNLVSIDAKKNLLRTQLNQWNNKEREYERLLSDLMRKKLESEKILKTQN